MKNEQDEHPQHRIDVKKLMQHRSLKEEESRIHSNSIYNHVLVGSQGFEFCSKTGKSPIDKR